MVVLVGLVGCGPEAPSSAWQQATWPEALEGDVVLEWVARDRWGTESFSITREGHAVFETRITAGEHSVRVERDLDARALEALRDELREQRCCALGGGSSAPPDATLRVRLPELSCDVSRPLEGWDELDAKMCERALRRVHGRPRFRE